MNEYTIWFEFFGRKMKTTIEANSRDEAEEILRDKIIFHKVDQTGKTNNPDNNTKPFTDKNIYDFFNGIFK